MNKSCPFLALACLTNRERQKDRKTYGKTNIPTNGHTDRQAYIDLERDSESIGIIKGGPTLSSSGGYISRCFPKLF